MPEELSFGVWLRRQRRALDLSRQAFANQAGCAEVTLRRIEAGTLKPSKELASILLEKLGVPATERMQWISFARGLSGFPLSSTPLSNKPIINLPLPITTFIGREKEQAEVIRLLSKHRLVTLTGSGGVGKTRLAIKVVAAISEEFPDGVWFLDLAPLRLPELVPNTLAALLELTEGKDLPITTVLINYFRPRRALVIFDNCEHLVDACAQLVYSLLTSCENLSILATSREALRISGESPYRVPSLEIPVLEFEKATETLEEIESVRLFADRAAAAKQDFVVEAPNALTVAQICQRLDGIPLAIELAAAWVNVLPVEKILNRLTDRFYFLRSNLRVTVARHQTLRGTIEWSYDLLPESERTLLRQVSIFVGGFSLQAADVICANKGLKQEDVLEQLQGLVDKSLVNVEHGNSMKDTRYRLLETIREYGLEKLSCAGEDNQIRIRHLEFFVQFVAQAKDRLRLSDQEVALRELDVEYGNLRSALEWAMESNPVRALQLSADMGGFWETRGYVREGRVAIEKALGKTLTASNALRAKGLYWVSAFADREGDYAKAKATIEEALTLFRSVGDQYGEVDSLVLLADIFMMGSIADPARGAEIAQDAFILAQSLGDIKRKADALNILAYDRRDFKRAFSYWKEAIKLYRQIGHQIRLAHSLSRFGFFLLLDGQLDAAQECIDEANSLFQKLNIKGRRGLLQGLGQIALIRGNYEQARAYFQEDAEISNEIGDRLDYLWAKSRLGFAELLAGNLPEARQFFTETVQNFQKDGNQIGVVFTLEGMSNLYITIGKADVAARLISWADTTREKIKDTRPKLEQADVDKVIAACIVAMGDVAYANAYDEGSKLTLDEAVAYALER